MQQGIAPEISRTTNRPVSVFRFKEQCTRPFSSAIAWSGKMKLDNIVSTALTVYLHVSSQPPRLLCEPRILRGNEKAH